MRARARVCLHELACRRARARVVCVVVMGSTRPRRVRVHMRWAQQVAAMTYTAPSLITCAFAAGSVVATITLPSSSASILVSKVVGHEATSLGGLPVLPYTEIGSSWQPNFYTLNRLFVDSNVCSLDRR